MQFSKQNIVHIAIVVFMAGIINNNFAGYPDFPYVNTHYDETYRGQFHFSPQSGWMNDVNGVWYSDGVYHLAFQHYPHGLEWGPMHWGRATSSDLLHWTQQPIMLEPDVNVPGDCWSGSTVVDVNNTAGFKTGENPVFVTLYTATTKGQYVAYSNDLGETWQAYNHPGTNGAVLPGGDDPRDPHVFWYEDHWVMALYQNGTTFYTSSDLKNWVQKSNVQFGYECPDLYELPVDGDSANKKWVLQDASGKYLIGSFDGLKYTADNGGPYLMDAGPDFYAAQTFFRGTMPDYRLVQMAWLSNWDDGLPTSPWSRDVTFPVELGLRTTSDGIRITRTPIPEISSLYGTSKHWDSKTVGSNQNLFSGLSGKCCDILAEFDLTSVTATTITFRIANKSIVYNIAEETLLGKPCAPINNRLKIRILADWSQLEVFGNDGLFSYTENFGFRPSDSSLAFSANGNVLLVSMDYHPVNRTWPNISSTSNFRTNQGVDHHRELSIVRNGAFVNIEANGEATVRITDTQGRLVRQVTGSGLIAVDTRYLALGAYVISANQQSNRLTKQVMITR